MKAHVDVPSAEWEPGGWREDDALEDDEELFFALDSF